jgi:pentose-5-phosphate-3-epimerase
LTVNQKIPKNFSFYSSILHPLRSSCESVHVDLMFDDFMPNSSPYSRSCAALKMRLDFIFYRFLMLSAMRLPSSMAYEVSCSTLLFRHFLCSTVST